MEVFLGNDPLLVQRSSWIVSICVETYPGLAAPWLKQLLRRTQDTGVHVAVKRNVVRLLQFVEIPRTLQGKVTNLCFDFLSAIDAPIAVKAFAMTVLANIAEEEPDLKQEIKLVIEEMLPYGSAGIQSRGKKILKRFS
jgi:hypothetical protein